MADEDTDLTELLENVIEEIGLYVSTIYKKPTDAKNRESRVMGTFLGTSDTRFDNLLAKQMVEFKVDLRSDKCLFMLRRLFRDMRISIPKFRLKDVNNLTAQC